MVQLRRQSKVDRAEDELEGVIDELLKDVLDDVIKEAEARGIAKERVLAIVEGVVALILDSRMA